MKRIASILAAAALLAPLALAQDDPASAPAPAPAKPARTLFVKARPADARTFERRLSVQGTLEAKNYANVSARIGGNLDEIFVDEGDSVRAGKTVLFQIDPAKAKNALTIAKQSLAVAKANLAVAEAAAAKTKAEARKAALDFERFQRLHDAAKVTDNEFEARDVANEQAKAGIAVADAQVELARRQVESAEANVAIAKKDFDDTKILAPLSGTVSSRTAEPGEFIPAGRVLLRIDDPSDLEAAAFLPAQYYPDVVPGTSTFRLAVAGQDVGTFPVTYRAPVINPTLRTFEIKGRLPGSGIAVPGAQADMAIVFSSFEAVAVPSDAILWRGGKPSVFVAAPDGTAHAVPVEPGIANDGFTAILSGLEPSDLVICEGQTQLNDGDAVTLLQ